jgi:transcriptional regulator with GAF, ATPase, and Fis domain
LITGESGTGKELVARAIHCSSPRAKAPFIPVNCVAIPGELAESLLFGHTRGSFTGALTDRKGWFELEDGGTLFLDEIGDMPPALQAKMLRVLEDGQVVPVGASHPRRVDVRVVAATNADLQDRIACGAFREDLYFRLARYLVEMPPLRDRVEDIGLLADHFHAVRQRDGYRSHRSHRALNCWRPWLSRQRARAEERHRTGGHRGSGRPIEPSHLRLMGRVSRQAPAAAHVVPPAGLPLNLEAAEQALIKRALQETAGNVMEAARLLGVNRSRIYRRFRHPES